MQVRILPMSNKNLSSSEYTIEQAQKNFFIRHLKIDKKNYRFMSKMNVKNKDIIFFQFKNKIIASAMIKDVICYDNISKDGYIGEYSFYTDTIKIFIPITAEELKLYCDNFIKFSQVKQRLNILNFTGLNDRINNNLINDDIL